MIKPEIGMPVIYHPHPDDHFGTMPVAGIIARVWGDNCVNLMLSDGGGMVQNRSSVLLHQGDDGQPNPMGGRWCQFPNWFLRLMVPAPLIVNPGPIDMDFLMNRPQGPWQVVRHEPLPYFAGTAVVPPASDDLVQCSGFMPAGKALG